MNDLFLDNTEVKGVHIKILVTIKRGTSPPNLAMIASYRILAFKDLKTIGRIFQLGLVILIVLRETKKRPIVESLRENHSARKNNLGEDLLCVAVKMIPRLDYALLKQSSHRLKLKTYSSIATS